MPTPQSNLRRAVFLDRDDTLIRCTELTPPPPPAARGDLVDPDLVELLPGALEACRRLHDAGYVLVIVSNQGVVARGAADIATVEKVNARVRRLLSTRDGAASLISGLYFCPFHPKGASGSFFTREHAWRKPGAGMFSAAASELGLDLRASWLIGDAPRDVEAGIAAGLPAPHCLRVGPDAMTITQAADRVLAPNA